MSTESRTATATATASHLAGPWRACQNGDCTCGMVWSIPGDFPVCTVANETGRNLQVVAVVHEHMADAPDMIYATLDRDVVLANARLIVAAPAMLAALRGVLDASNNDENGWWPCWDEVRAAIAQATGGTVTSGETAKSEGVS